jgi:hypothetical protein
VSGEEEEMEETQSQYKPLNKDKGNEKEGNEMRPPVDSRRIVAPREVTIEAETIAKTEEGEK